MPTLKQTYEDSLQELRTQRDQIRLKLHLATQEARTQWETHLEPHVERIEQQLKDAREDTVDAVKDAIDRARAAFQEFLARLGGDDERRALDETQRRIPKTAR
jgi:ribosome recycling factor